LEHREGERRGRIYRERAMMEGRREGGRREGKYPQENLGNQKD
jgi:hypothetical protein